MKNVKLSILLIFITASTYAQKNQKMLVFTSELGVAETVEEIKSNIQQYGLTLFSVINHSESAKKVGFDLQSNTVILFGNPWVGTQLMNCDPKVGFDLPLRILVWEEKGSGGNSATKVGYYDPTLLLDKYKLKDCEKILKTINGAMAGIMIYDLD